MARDVIECSSAKVFAPYKLQRFQIPGDRPRMPVGKMAREESHGLTRFFNKRYAGEGGKVHRIIDSFFGVRQPGVKKGNRYRLEQGAYCFLEDLARTDAVEFDPQRFFQREIQYFF